MNDTLIKYDHVYQFIGAGKKLTIDPKCNSWFITNTGTTICFVNGVPLNPGVVGTTNGETFVSGGNRAELFVGRIDVKFSAAAGSACIFVQKVYLLEC